MTEPRPRLFIDADACPVKDEVYKVARRYRLKVFVVSNSFILCPRGEPLIESVVVDAGPDVADDWIAERVEPGDIVVTGDIPLAGRVLEKQGQAINSKGTPFTARGGSGASLPAKPPYPKLKSFASMVAALTPCRVMDDPSGKVIRVWAPFWLIARSEMSSTPAMPVTRM